MKIKCFLAAFALSAAMIGSSAAAACDMSMLYKVKSSALFNECSREAQNGSAKAQHTLGYLYEAGEGVRANIPEGYGMVPEGSGTGISCRTDLSRPDVLQRWGNP